MWASEGRHTRSYAYDTFGNLTSLGGTAIAVDPATNRLAGGAMYDGRGNLVDEPMGTWTRHLRWDEEGRLLAAWGEGAGAPAGAWAFAYDHNGERVLKYRVEDGAVAEARLFLRDEQGNVLTEMAWVETDAAGYWARAKDHVYLGLDLIGTLDRATGDPQVVNYARDHLGSQRAEVWALDASTATDLWPYGALARTKAAGTAPSLADGAYLFTGHEREHVDTAPAPDPLLGLDYMHARYYSCRRGRFLSVDPVGGEVGLSQSWNRYAYVGDNPVIATDPTGETIRVSGDGMDELNLLKEALDDPELAKSLALETRQVTHSFLGLFFWTTTETVVTNGGADWSKSSNPNARLLDAAIDTSTVIDFAVTSSTGFKMRDAGGAITDSGAFSTENRISITINPKLVRDSVVAVRNPANPEFLGGGHVPVGVAVIHEFGHAWGNFHDRVPGHKINIGSSTAWQAVEWENRARKRYFARRPWLQPLLRADHGNPMWWKR